VYRILRVSMLGQRWRGLVLQKRADNREEIVRQHGIFQREWSPEWKAAITTTLDVLLALDAAARNHDATLVVGVFPAPWELSQTWRDSVGIVGDSWDVTRIQRLLLQFFGEHRIVAVPLSTKLGEAMASGTTLFFQSDGHLNAEGHRIAGEALAAALIEKHVIAAY